MTRRATLETRTCIVVYRHASNRCSTKFYREFVYGGGSGIPIRLGQFTEHTLGGKQRSEIMGP